MASRSPKQVIRDYLSAQRSLVASQSAPGTTGWRAETSSGGFDAKPETFQFGTVRRIPLREVHAVMFETQDDQRMRFICCVRQDKGGIGSLLDALAGQ